MGALEKLESETLTEVYFVAISLLVAFGLLQTAGTALSTEKPVVSVVSCSMYPQLHVGDVVVVRGVPFENIEENDTAVYSVKEADLTVNGQKHEVAAHREPTSTAAGEVRIRQVRTSFGGEAIGAVFEVSGETVALEEGQTAEVGGATVELREVRGMNIPIVHRVVEKREVSMATKGDNNDAQLPFEDSIEPEQVHGKMLFKVPRIGGLKILMMDLAGFGPADRPLAIDSYPRCTRNV